MGTLPLPSFSPWSSTTVTCDCLCERLREGARRSSTFFLKMMPNADDADRQPSLTAPPLPLGVSVDKHQ